MRSSSQDSALVPHLWLNNPVAAGTSAYYPAIMIECKLTFRSLRATYHHSEERIYTAWYPENDLPINWDEPIISLAPGTKFSSIPLSDLPKQTGNFLFTASRLAEMQDELISSLVRKEKFSLLYNPVFKIYSTPGQTRDEFLDKVSEIALTEMEPELRDLMRKVELKLEQVRESQERKGRKDPLPEPNLLKNIEQRSEIFTSKTRLTSMFLNSAKRALKPKISRGSVDTSLDKINFELNETLRHIEQEANEEVNQLWEIFLERSQQCDKFDIGLQHQNIQVLRRAILWLAY
ncbi:MAG: hypothetical protein IPK14_27155 [Blastocatellia bacterium]|nr:hypothetical protein [Blastocatellia bacterium]MBL8195737.1 hypothetical protein [Blastocatellia bacterium]MBN8724375.1 hypothetical protein [Acidobacteriota bacterium]